MAVSASKESHWALLDALVAAVCFLHAVRGIAGRHARQLAAAYLLRLLPAC